MVTSLRPADGGSSMAEVIRGEASGGRLKTLAPQLREPVVLPAPAEAGGRSDGLRALREPGAGPSA